TPRDVTDYIVTQVATGESSACLSQQAFYFLRRGFSNRLQLPRTAFHPDVPLQRLIPKETRKHVWRQLQTEMGPNALPNLARPLWLFYLLFAGTIFLSVFVPYARPGMPFQLRLVIGSALLVAV